MQRGLAWTHLLQGRTRRRHAALVITCIEIATHNRADGVAPLGGRKVRNCESTLRGFEGISVPRERHRKRNIDVQRLTERGPIHLRLEIVSGGAARLTSTVYLVSRDVIAPEQPEQIYQPNAPQLLLSIRGLGKPTRLRLHFL